MKKFIYAASALVSLLLLSQCVVRAEGVVVREPVYEENYELYLIPGTYVYWMSVGNGDVFFCDGYWWQSRYNAWYRSGAYSGPWIVIETRFIPYQIVRLPPRWKEMRDNSPRIRWGDVRSHWREWEREKYWERQEWKREVRRESYYEDRGNRKNEKGDDKNRQESNRERNKRKEGKK